MPLITDGIVLEINRRQVKEPIRFIGMEKTMPVQFTAGLGTESGIDPLDFLWRGFHKQKENTSGLFLEEEIGVSYPCPDPGYFNYFAGARAGTEAAAGYREWKLPEGEYIVCSFEAENFEALVMDALYKAQQYFYGTWIPKHKLQTEPFCAERYADHSPETGSMEIWAKVIQP